jgi:DNA polymerase V
MKEVTLYGRISAEKLIPLFADTINESLTSPVSDHEDARINLDAYLSNYPQSMFFAKVEGECMIGSGIFPDDLLVVDRTLTPKTGDVVIGTLNGDLVLRSYFVTEGKVFLMPDNNHYKPIELNGSVRFEIWGVVPHTIYNQRRRNNARLNRFHQRLG